MRDTIKQTLQTEWFLVRLMFKTDAVCGASYWLFSGIQYAIPLVSVWLWKLILDELTVIYQTHAASGKVWFFLGIYLALQVLSSVLVQINYALYQKIKRRTSRDMDIVIMQKMAQIDTAFFDDPKNRDAMNAALTSESYIAESLPWAIDTIIRIISFISGFAMFLSYNWLFGIIFMATYIPGAIVSYKHKAKADQWSIDNIPETRKKNYYKSLLTGRYFAKDLRLYDLAGHFRKKYQELWDKIRNERAKLFAQGAVASVLASLLTYCGVAVILLLSVHSVLAGSMAIGTLALYIGLAQTTGENFKTIIDDIACQIEIDVPRVIQYKNFLQYENMIKDTGKAAVLRYPEIEFRNVYFKYPGNEEFTLKDLSFKIGSGKKVALIGVNGAGKTTVIKLLLRFYEPESGEILLDGKNIREYSLCAVHNMFSVCFQNINCYSQTLRENIAISDIDRKNDTEAVKAAAAAAGANSIIAELENGLETDMTRRFNDKGAELSGGQWQKVALARAFFRNSRFVILDEPSSALDPEAEDYIFSSFMRLCCDNGGILVSHRLSSIMMVDGIILLDSGTVLESGTHSELMEKNGKYAEMYRMQAKKYRGGAK